MSKIDKVIARQTEKIHEGQFYEAHQQLRVIAARYIKQNNYGSAIDILSSGAKLLLDAGQGASGGDLCMMLLEVFIRTEQQPDSASKGRVLSLLRAFPVEEPTKRRFIGEVIAWSSKFGEYPAGDPELHHVAAQIYAQEGETYEAEKHFVLGTKDSPSQFATMEFAWYSSDDSHTAGVYAARGVLPYILIGNIHAANLFLSLFISKLSNSSKNLGIQDVSSMNNTVHVHPSLPLLNFLQLLLLAIERGNADTFKMLRGHYQSYLAEFGAWEDALEQIGELYFGIRKPTKNNAMFDMLGSMLMGGSSNSPRTPSTRLGMPTPSPHVD